MMHEEHWDYWIEAAAGSKLIELLKNAGVDLGPSAMKTRAKLEKAAAEAEGWLPSFKPEGEEHHGRAPTR